MIHSQPALDPDRLPWLTAEPATQGGGVSPLITWGGAALLLVAGVSYWLGREGEVTLPQVPQWTETARETVRLPEPRAAAEPAAIEPAATAPAKPVAAPRAPSVSEQVNASPRKAAGKPARRVKPRPTQSSLTQVVRRQSAAAARPVQRRRAVPHWPLPATALYMGRMITLGTYSSAEKLERAWRYRATRYPQLRGLPKVVVPYEARGKTYYQLQVMTTAKAQSDWICRKIRSHWRTCSVLRPAAARTANG